MKIIRAGVIPFYVQEDKIYYYLMKPSMPEYGGDRFQIAKGKMEAFESPAQAAFREGYEELGLLSSNILRRIYLGEFLGRTHFYLAEIISKSNFDKPTFETGETCWLTLAEFKECGRQIHIPVLEVAEMKIKALIRT